MLLLLDGNNLAWAGYYALERVMKPEDDERKLRVAALGLAGAVLGAITRRGEPPDSKAAPVPLTRAVIVFDEGRPLRRRQMFPPYQTGRENDPKFITNEPTILHAIADFTAAMADAPVDVLRGINTEADDLIAGVVQANPDAVKRIVSTDRDFLQLVGPKLTVYAPVKKLVIADANFNDAAMPKSSAGTPQLFPRQRFLDYRALVGDTSDDVPGVPGIGPLTAAKLLAAGTVESYYGKPEAVRSACGRKSLAVEAAFTNSAAEQIVERNRALMDLRRAAPCWDQLDELTQRGTWNRERFEPWFDELRISGVNKEELFAAFDELAGNPSGQLALPE